MNTLVTTKRCWAVLVGCCLLVGMSFTFPVMMFGIFVSPIAHAFNSSITEVNLYFTFAMGAAVVSCTFGHRALQKSIRMTVLVCSLIMCAAYSLLAAFPSAPMVWICGLACGLCYPLCSSVLTPIAINNWFAVRQGTLIGIALAMVGLFGMGLSPLYTALIEQLGWQMALMCAAIPIGLVGVVCAVFLLRQSAEDEGQARYGQVAEDERQARYGQASAVDAAQTSAADASQASQASQTPQVAQAAQTPQPSRTPQALDPQTQQSSQPSQPSHTTQAPQESLVTTTAFFLVAAAVFLSGVLCDFNNQFNSVAQGSGFSAVQAGYATSSISAGLLVGKLFMGWLKDTKGARATMVAAGISGVVAYAIVLAGIVLSNVILVYLGCFISAFCSCLGTLSPALLSSEAFPPSFYNKAISYTTALLNLGMAVGVPLFSLTFDMTGSYIPVLAAWVVLPICIAVCGMVGVRVGQRRMEYTNR